MSDNGSDREEEDVRMLVRAPGRRGAKAPSPCTTPFLLCYLVAAAIVVLCAVTIAVLVAYPKASTSQVLLHQGDLVFVTLSLSSRWLSSLSMSVEDMVCDGEVYANIPCDNLTNMRSRNKSYNPHDFVSDDANMYIYTLGDSTFYIQLTDPEVNHTDLYVWALDDPCLYEKSVYDEPDGVSVKDCDNPPGNSICRRWNASQTNGYLPTPRNLLACNGTYYFLLIQPLGTKFNYTVDRYYYEASHFSEYHSTTFNVRLNDDFDPWSMFKRSTCILFNATTCNSIDSAGTLDVSLTRGDDFLVWPGVPAVFTLLLCLVVLFGHVHDFQRRKEAYRRAQRGEALDEHVND